MTNDYKVDFRTYHGELIVEAYLLPGKKKSYKKQRLTKKLLDDLYVVLVKEAFIHEFLKHNGEGSVTFTENKPVSVTYYSKDQIT